MGDAVKGPRMNSANKAPPNNRRCVAMTVAALAICNAQAVDAAEEDSWSFELAPFLFAAGMEGTTGIRGVEAEVDLDFDTILENLDSAFLARFEARRGPWGMSIEGISFNLGGEKVRTWSGPLGNANTAALDWRATEKVYQATLFYEVLHGEQKLDVLIGARYTVLDTRLDLTLATGAPLLPDGARTVSQDESWTDPVIGVRLRASLSETWHAVVLADVGGFGAGSDLTYQMYGAIGWRFARHWSAELGYRYVYQDYQKDDFRWDIATSGPQLGIALKW